MVAGLRNNASETSSVPGARLPGWPGARLRKHADYQRVYRESRKHASASMSYFFRLRSAGDGVAEGPRVGLTAGKVLGGAVDRNRIKRRMREAARRHLDLLTLNVDVILHPRRNVLEVEFDRLDAEVARIFTRVRQAAGETGR